MNNQNNITIEDSSVIIPENIRNNGAPDLEGLLNKYDLNKTDFKLVREHLKPLMVEHIPEMIVDFYVWLKDFPEYKKYFEGNNELLVRTQKMQGDYWLDLLSGDVSMEFVNKRVNLARTHSRIKLSLDTYFAGLAFFTNWILDWIKVHIKDAKGRDMELMLASTHAMMKIQQVDMAIVVDEFIRKSDEDKNELILHLQRQAATINKLATPIAILAEDILLVSVIGVLDSKRGQDILEATLSKVLETISKVAIIDIAGVDFIDTAVANHLIKMTQAIKLMGCSCILSGVSPAIALTVVQLGLDLSELQTKAVLRDAVESAYKIVKQD